MWNIAAQAGTGVAIASLGATYYALIRKNVEMENRAMDDLAAIASKEEEDKRKVNEASGDITGSENKIPTTTSRNLLRKNFQLLGKQSGRIFGINVAHSHELLVEKNHSESALDQNIVNRTELFPSKSTSILLGARKSKSDFDMQRKFKCHKPMRMGDSFDFYRSRSDVFQLEESSSLDVSEELNNQDHLEEPLKICHCKYSASADDVSLHVSKEHIVIEKCEKIESGKQTKDSKLQAPNITDTSPRKSSLYEKQMNGSLLSEDYYPRLENRMYGTSSIVVPAMLQRKSSPSQEKVTQILFQSPERKFQGNNLGHKVDTDHLEKDSIENNEEPQCEIYEECTFSGTDDNKSPSPKELLSLKIESVLEESLKTPVTLREIFNFGTEQVTNRKDKNLDEYHQPPESENASSVMLSLPDTKVFSFSVGQVPRSVETRENTNTNNSVPEPETTTVFERTSPLNSSSMIELSTTDSWQMVKTHITKYVITLMKTFLYGLLYIINIPVGTAVAVAFAILALAFFIQIATYSFQDMEENPADSAFPEQNHI